MILNLDPAPARFDDEITPSHVNPIQWQQSVGLARQICARVFRDGGSAGDALAAFGLAPTSDLSWDKAVDLMAAELTRQSMPSRRAA